MKRNWMIYAALAPFLLPGLSFGQVTLDINRVSTNVRPANSLFWDGMVNASYEVPKGSGKHAMYLGSLWLIGENTANGTLAGFAERYRQNGPETWTGPLKTDGSASSSAQVVSDFGKVWKVTQSEIDVLRQARASGALQAGTYVPPADIAGWPGNGPAGYAQRLAPFFDADGDGVYNILNGDYPLIKGEQMLYWILNDSYGVHPESGLSPMGVEIHISFYACKNEDASEIEDFINYTTFLEYEIINRSARTYQNIYAGFNTDCDIGYAMDDRTGSHVDADAFYFYNSDPIDAQATEPAPNQYGKDWPVQSIAFLEGKEVNGRRMSGYMYYNSSSGPTGEPFYTHGEHYYNYLRSRFKDDTPLHYGGDGYPGNPGVTGIPARYMFPGNSDSAHAGTDDTDPGFDWVQAWEGDQRGLGSTGPFTLAPGGNIKVVLGLISTFDSSLSTVLRVEKNRQQNKLLRNWYNAGDLPCVMSEAHLGTPEAVPVGQVKLFPNPANESVRLSGEGLHTGMTYTLTDVQGRSLGTDQVRQDGYVEVATDALSPGVYFIRLEETSGKVSVLKFIRE